MRTVLFRVALAATAVWLAAPPVARAGFITGEVWVNQTPAAGDAVLGYGDPTNTGGTTYDAVHPYLGTPDATFNSGAFNYNSNVSGYTIGPFLNNPAFTGTSAAFSASGDLNETYFYFTGAIHLNAGDNSFVVGHDDGLQLNIDGIGLVVNTPGPTAFEDTPFNVNAPSAGNYNFELSYGETLGPPAQLLWEVNGATITSDPVAPVPGSLTMLGCGVATLFGFARWRRQAALMAG